MSNTGGPAFPTENEHQSGNQLWHYEGMTLRDYFAAKAMQGLFARDRNRKLVVNAEENARTAYDWADAMLKAREQ